MFKWGSVSGKWGCFNLLLDRDFDFFFLLIASLSGSDQKNKGRRKVKKWSSGKLILSLILKKPRRKSELYNLLKIVSKSEKSEP